MIFLVFKNKEALRILIIITSYPKTVIIIAIANKEVFKVKSLIICKIKELTMPLSNKRKTRSVLI